MFTTAFQGESIPSFIDSGSNGFFYDNPNLPVCPGGWYCPGALSAQSATNTGSDDVSGVVDFDIADANTLFSTPNAVFSDLGANIGESISTGDCRFFSAARYSSGWKERASAG